MRLTTIKQTEPPEQPDVERQSQSLGGRLRQAREAKGLTIEQISATTRISISILNALENNSPEKLPSAVACRAFIKIYGELLGLDIGELLALLAKTDQKQKQHAAPAVTSKKLLQSETYAERPIIMSGKQVLPAIFIIILLFFSFIIYRVYFSEPSAEAPQETKELSTQQPHGKTALQNQPPTIPVQPAPQPERSFQPRPASEKQQPPLPLPGPLPRQTDQSTPALSTEISTAPSNQRQAAGQNPDQRP